MSTIVEPTIRMQYLLARSDYFRAWCGITTGTEAEKLAATLEHVHVEGITPENIASPFAVVEPDNFQAMRVGMGGGCFDRSQSVIITFGQTSSAKGITEIVAEKLTYKGVVRNVINDLLAASGTGTKLSFDMLKQRHPAELTGESSREKYWLWDFEVSGDMQGSQDE